jgi:hypothetical protein
MKNIYYVVMLIQKSINVAGVKINLPGKGFLPVFESKEEAEAYAPPGVEILEIESKEDKE